MSAIAENIAALKTEIPAHVKLVAVSKTKPNADLIEAYNAGQRIFGENYVQELCDKQASLPSDIQWHFIGHLQSNKVKYIAPFVACIHAVDSEKLIAEINKQGEKNNRVISIFLQVHIAQEETKFGWDETELISFLEKVKISQWPFVRVCGLMGMASFSDNLEQVRSEFKSLKHTFDALKSGVLSKEVHFKELSMGMSGDWKAAIEEGSTMVRIGSSIFGNRIYTNK